MDGVTFKAWLSEPRAIKKLPNGLRRVLYVDNCSGHVIDDDTTSSLNSISTTIQKFPPNATHLLQPADSFVIQKLKDAWRKRWDDYKYECIRRETWTASSGKLPNPGKPFLFTPGRCCGSRRERKKGSAWRSICAEGNDQDRNVPKFKRFMGRGTTVR